LWSVGRRLAFSYFLIGVLPIPMVLLLLLTGAYILAGFFMGHLFRDATRALQGELQAQADARLADFARMGRPPEETGGRADVVFGYYRNGRRVAGDPHPPAAWPAYLVPHGDDGRHETLAPLFAREDGTPALVALAARGPASGPDFGVVALYAGP